MSDSPRGPADDLPVIRFADAAAFEIWLEANLDAPGLWLEIAKASAPEATIRHPEAIDVGLCFGWIDSQRRGLNETHYLQRFTPRRPRGRWSQINREKVEALEAAGRMRPAGIAEVAAAKADGRWDAAYRQKGATVPDDLAEALGASPAAAEFFAGLSSQNRFAVIFRLDDAKRPETRRRRLEKFVAMLERGETLH